MSYKQIIIAIVIGVGIIGAFGFQQSQIQKQKKALEVYQQVINNQGNTIQEIVDFLKKAIAEQNNVR